MELRAISLKQPYADAILRGGKRIENRPRKVGIRMGGEWLLLHASKGFYWTEREWGRTGRDILQATWPDAPAERADYKRGAILGVMHVRREERYTEELLCREPGEQRGWAFGPICLIIGEVRAFDEPIPAKGALGLWRPATPRSLSPSMSSLLRDYLRRLDLVES